MLNDDASRPAVVCDEPGRRLPVLAECDVVVLGGGPAGIAAATAAARRGASTWLVERHGFLGGMGTAAGVTNFCGLYADVHGRSRRVVHGIATELLDRMGAMDGLAEPHLIFGRVHAQAYDNAAFKCAADALLASAGARVLFHAWAAAVVAKPDGDRVDALVVETKSGRLALRARVFVDASGDGDLAHFAGLAMEKGDGAGSMLYPTLMFRVGNVDAARAGDAWATIPLRIAEAEAAGDFAFPRHGAIVRPQPHPWEWRVNVTQLRNADGSAVDGTDALSLSAAECEGRRQAVEFLRFLRARIPGFEHAYLLELAPQLGIRETRRLVGETMLTADDVLGCADFADSIGVNGWPLELHVAGGVEWRWPAVGSRGYNQLPYRMLLPQAGQHRGGNLLVAGRCAGMTHEGQSAARVSGACFAMGQAAGTAAAIAAGTAAAKSMKAGVAAVPGGGGGGVAAVDVARLQAALEADGAWLGGDEATLPVV